MQTSRIVLAAVLGGVTMFLWGALSHTVIPFSENALLGFTNDDAVVQTIMANAPKSGVYFMPYVPQKQEGMTEEEFKAAQQSAEDKMQQGPFMLAAVRLGEMGSFGSYLLIQLVTDILTALLVCLVLMRVTGSLWNRVGTAELVGLAGFAGLSLPQWNWYAFSGAFTLAELFDVAVGFFLGGLVIAKILGRAQKEAVQT